MFVECPKCGSTNARPSRSFGLFDSIMKSWSRLPYRCRACRKRFYQFDTDLAEEREQELDLIGEQEVLPQIATVPTPARWRRYRVVIRIRLPRLLRPRAV